MDRYLIRLIVKIITNACKKNNPSNLKFHLGKINEHALIVK